jgi:phosphoribosylaminoimidazole-succinocarboxamide synthase
MSRQNEDGGGASNGSPTAPLQESALPFPIVTKGKVREMYDVGEDRLLMVASDRLSAFDVVMDRPIPRKGEVLTAVTVWWLDRLDGLVESHLLASDPDAIEAAVPRLADHRDEWAGRALLVRRAEPVPIECVVRGYITGSAWKEYHRAGTLAGEPLPEGLVECGRLDPPVFSPATKAESGHDENITFSEAQERIDPDLAHRLRALSLDLYERGRTIAEERGIILADTKFEFGLRDGKPILIDEVMTPDSSRFWPRESYAPGRGQPSLDKQPVRDYLDDLTRRGEWNKKPPPPDLPDEVVAATTRRYLEVHRRLTGRELGA